MNFYSKTFVIAQYAFILTAVKDFFVPVHPSPPPHIPFNETFSCQTTLPPTPHIPFIETFSFQTTLSQHFY